MTPKKKATICYYAGIPMMLLAIFMAYLAKSQGGGLPVLLFAISVAGFLFLAVYSVFTSRCPHCARHMNLAGPGAHCPHCGAWSPFREDEKPKVEESKGAVDRVKEDALDDFGVGRSTTPTSIGGGLLKIFAGWFRR